MSAADPDARDGASPDRSSHTDNLHTPFLALTCKMWSLAKKSLAAACCALFSQIERHRMNCKKPIRLPGWLTRVRQQMARIRSFHGNEQTGVLFGKCFGDSTQFGVGCILSTEHERLDIPAQQHLPVNLFIQTGGRTMMRRDVGTNRTLPGLLCNFEWWYCRRRPLGPWRRAGGF